MKDSIIAFLLIAIPSVIILHVLIFPPRGDMTYWCVRGPDGVRHIIEEGPGELEKAFRKGNELVAKQ